MKELEFINSRLEDGSALSTTGNDYPTASGNENEATPLPTKSSAPETSLAGDEINVVVAILKNFNDKLTIYRSTLDDLVDGRSSSGKFVNDGIIKIRDDSLYVSNLFDNLTERIETCGSYDVLVREIERDEKKRIAEMTVARDYAEAKKRAIELRELVVKEKMANVEDKEGPKSRLVQLKNENERLELTVKIESTYARHREKARCEAIFLRWEGRSKSLLDMLGNVDSAVKNERRVATEIEAFLKQNATANEIAVSQWRDRYERELQMYKIENQRLKNDIDNRRKLLEKLGDEYRVREEFIEKYLKEKEASAEREKLENHRRNSSIKVQSWWRGVMVRRKLGPYRPDEKKKKRAAKSKK